MFHVEQFEKNVPRGTFLKLKQYEALLIKWQSKINLIASSTVNEIWERHMCDSLQLIEYLPNKEASILDVGSGAGFPGLVLVIAGYKNVCLVEANEKKVNFLKHVAHVLALDVTILHQRVELLKEGVFDVVVCRGVSSLVDLLKMVDPRLSGGGCCLFHKGKNHLLEIEDAKRRFDFCCETYKSKIHDEGVILKVSDLQKK